MTTELIPGQEPLIAPGVRGYTVEREGALWVPLVFSVNPGNGDVGRFLDSLPKDRTVKFPTVLSMKLEGMLERRGFTLTTEWCEEFGCDMEVWVRTP